MSSPVSFARPSILALALFSTLIVPSFSLQVTPGSACASYCLDNGAGDPHDPKDSTTTPSDVVCENADYWSTSAGTKYRTCINCLQNSTAVNGTESDTAWYLYNLRYVVDVCLFSYPSVDSKNTSLSSPCDLPSNCEPLRTALTSNLHAHNGTDLGYCTADNSAFEGSSVDDCMQCLQTEPQQTYLANFLTALSAGCQQKPPAGGLLGLNGTLFSASAVGIITPKWNETAPAKASSVSTLNTGTIVGLSLGIGLLLVGALAIFFYWQRQKRRNARQDFDDFSHKRSPSQANSISSSMNGSIAPFYATDYKTQHAGQDPVELYNRIKTQNVVFPTQGAGAAPQSSVLWGQETPSYLAAAQRETGAAPSARQIMHAGAANTNSGASGQNLGGVPIHPAFVPRAFARPSRGLAPLSQAETRVKTYKPDAYVESLAARNSKPATADVAAARRPAPPPPTAPKTTPSLVLPSLSRTRKSRTYIPPPIIVDGPATRNYVPAESGKP